jgi:type II secretory pathway pseudopilin PulG
VRNPGIQNRKRSGFSLLEAVLTMAIAGLVLGMAVPALGRWRDRAALQSAAARLVREVRYSLYRDGDGDGVRMADLLAGVDPKVEGPYAIGREIGPVDFGLPGPIASIPPSSGQLDPADPVQLGATDILSLSPLGTATSGTLYLQGMEGRVIGAVVYGPTARVRLWIYNPATRGWTQSEGPGAL